MISFSRTMPFFCLNHNLCCSGVKKKLDSIPFNWIGELPPSLERLPIFHKWVYGQYYSMPLLSSKDNLRESGIRMEGLRSNLSDTLPLQMKNQVWTIYNLYLYDIFALENFLIMMAWNIQTYFSKIEMYGQKSFVHIPGKMFSKSFSLWRRLFGSGCLRCVEGGRGE